MTELEKVPFDMKLEVVVLGVSDVNRAKAFYENLGWRLDIDIAAGDFRGVQMTPHNSEASIIFGKGITSAKPSSAHSLVLAVDDLDAARVDVSAVCSRRSSRGFPAANGSRREQQPWTSRPLQSSSARRRSTTTATRKRTPSTTGGTGTRPT